MKGRIIAGIPEEKLVKHYVGKHVKEFSVDCLPVHAPSIGSQTILIVLRWFLTDNNRISVYYTASRSSIMITHKVRWLGERDIAMGWSQTHYKLIKLCDPDGERLAEDYITNLARDHKNGQNECCATPDILGKNRL